MGDFASRKALPARAKIKSASIGWLGAGVPPLRPAKSFMLCAMSAERIKALLERREAIAREIARHPRPITGCDVHFNRLLEERATISEEIDRLEALQAPRTKPTISSP